MKKILSTGLIALTGLLVFGIVAAGLYAAVSGNYLLGNGQHQGQGQGQGRGRMAAVTVAHGEGERLAQDDSQPSGRGGRGSQSAAPVVSQAEGRDAAEPRTTAAELTTFRGVVTAVEGELMIETDSGQTVVVGMGPTSYRESLDFQPQVGDSVTVTGFDEDGQFKATEIVDHTTGQTVALRDEEGRPAWAGRGRGRGRGA